ncbi:MAG: hypothetical protein JNL08_19760 [Planctomycetes bacterium]|nr:hypothetical protein [Planctomycetota bacterium]
MPGAVAPFVGSHRGTLRMYGENGVREVPMGLDVEPVAGATDRLRWVLRYGEGASAQARDYLLLVDDAAAGRYRIDEQNGIVLPARLCDGELVSVFAVGGQVLVARYRAVAVGVEFALESFGVGSDGSDAATPTTGAATGAAGVTPIAEVAVQRALLHRTTGAR